MFDVEKSPYVHDLYKDIKNADNNNNNSVVSKLDIQELYYIYTLATGGTL